MHGGDKAFDPASASNGIAYGEQLMRSEHSADRRPLQRRLDVNDPAEGRNTLQPVNRGRLVRRLQQ
ncbi:hypothetical protein D3C71_1985210 [compost metagenome]